MNPPFRTALLSGKSFLPTDIAGLKLWLAADRITGLSDGNPVATWSDLSGNGNNATQSTASKKPLLKLVSGKWYVRFDGTDDCLQVPSFTIKTFFTIFVVGKFTNAAPMFIEQSANSNPNDGFYFYGTDANSWNVRRTSIHTAQGVTNWMGTSLGLAEFVYDGTGAYLLNGSVQSNGTITGTARSNSSVTDALNIGSRNQASLFTSGDFGEILIYEGALSSTDRSRVRAYLNSKYGL